MIRPVEKEREEEEKSNDPSRQVRLPIKDQDQSSLTSEHHRKKAYLKARLETTQSVRMLTDEVSQIQEVRYCLKTLREQMAARQNSNINNKHPANGFKVSTSSSQSAVSINNNNVPLDTHLEDDQEESARLREVTRRLYAQLKEMEKRHQEERDRLEANSKEYRTRLAEQSERLQAAERLSEKKGQQVEELHRLLKNMELESGVLKDKVAAGEAELLRLKADGDEEDEESRCAELEKEVSVLKEKIYHLDDMQKSQQRKVRHMIEMLQNARTIVCDRDRTISDLKERVAFLEAENKELHDRVEYLQTGQDPPPPSVENKPEIVYSKPLKPTSPTNKALPLIKVIEIKS